MSAKRSEKIELLLKSLPEKPGVYRYYDQAGKIIYVGKAKNLKRRVSSYFNKVHPPGKLRLLVSKIWDIHTFVVDSEWEALLLENNMIKEFKPRYNILLKDDKSYPWIAISKEDFPRVYSTRQPNKTKEQLFGPYASVKMMNTLLTTIFEIFPLRNCKHLPLNSRPCIQHQIKKCSAPCANLITKEQYQVNISKIIEIIRGNSNLVINQLKEEMMEFAGKWEFENAQLVKEKILLLESFKGKSIVVNPEITEFDIFSIVVDDESAYINFIRIVEGSIIQAYTLEIGNIFNSSKEELLSMGIVEIEHRFGTLFSNIIVPFIPDSAPEGRQFHIPQRGDKRKLLELSERNARLFMMEKKKRLDLVNPERNSQRVMEALQKALNMDSLPKHIECFDNSNTQGAEPVAAMVCFMNGKPAKKEYRHYNIKTVVGANDFASMEEVVYRRYKRLQEENKPLPELVVIDGGKGQLSSAYQALKSLQLENKIMLIGIAKRLEDIYKVGDELPIYIDKRSEAQKLIQSIRDEVHRFGITHHRKKRAKKSFSSELDTIPGIGKVLADKLLMQFKSVKRITMASEEEIAKTIGKSKAKIVFNFFHQ